MERFCTQLFYEEGSRRKIKGLIMLGKDFSVPYCFSSMASESQWKTSRIQNIQLRLLSTPFCRGKTLCQYAQCSQAKDIEHLANKSSDYTFLGPGNVSKSIINRFLFHFFCDPVSSSGKTHTPLTPDGSIKNLEYFY